MIFNLRNRETRLNAIDGNCFSKFVPMDGPLSIYELRFCRYLICFESLLDR